MKEKFYLALKILFTVGSVFLCFIVPIRQGNGQSINRTEKDIVPIQKTTLKEIKKDVILGKTPLYFIPNKGQVNEKALYYAKTDKYTLWLTKEGFVFDDMITKNKQDKKGENKFEFIRDCSWLNFLNSSNETKIIPMNLTEHEVNYFIGNDSSKWKTSIKTSKAVLYKNLYNKIDLKVYGIEKQIEYDFIVSPGGNPSDIKFEYQEIKDSWIDVERNLTVETEFGQLKHAEPFCFQLIEGKQVQIKAEFKRIKDCTYGFEIGEYNRNFPLFIDPLIFSTYLGGQGDDHVTSLALDNKNNIYVVGYTSSTDFPTKNPFQNTNAGWIDVFITKIKPNGQSLVYSTYLGGQLNGTGQGSDRGSAIAVDEKGAVYVTGTTWSRDFPIKNAIQTELAHCSDVFISKLNSRGNKLIYSTYLGGNAKESGYAIAVDENQVVYIGGYTDSYNFPTENPFQSDLKGNGDAFIAKISPQGNQLLYSTYFGGKGADDAYGIAVDKTGAIYIAGYTSSNDFPTQKPYQRTLGGNSDAYVTKFNSQGNTLLFSTYLGGSDWDWANAICLDNKNCIYITGMSQSQDFPIKKAYQKNLAGETDVIIIKMKPKGNALFFSTYFGGSDNDYGDDIVQDSNNNIYVTGFTKSSDFPVKNPVQETYGGGFSDLFVLKFKPRGKSLFYSTFLGGTNADFGSSLAVDKNSCAYITGYTLSNDFPLKRPLFNSYSDQHDVIIFKIK